MEPRPPTLVIVGRVESSLRDAAAAPRQPDEGAPAARVRIGPEYRAALTGLHAGDRITLVTWLDRADRDRLVTRPRGDAGRTETGVFATRSPDRPNPIGLHRVRVLAAAGARLQVAGLEALDGTPIVDVKPVLGRIDER